MLLYLIKSAACMAIFFAFYKLLLEKENMHVFKRFYLLLAITASLAIPTLVFTEYVIVEPISNEEIQPVVFSNADYEYIPERVETNTLDGKFILWTVYFFGLFFFGFKFIKNLFQIVGRIRKNEKQKSTSIIHVLLQENFPPHTFFKYIFLNKKKLESNEIPQEVLLHKETHARQKHSIDVVLIELLQVVLWFNPLVYLFKKAIKLNHEFLADQAVLAKEVDEKSYQNTLLSYLSNDSKMKYQLDMTNAINYSSIKKRFTVMKKRSSKKSLLIRSILLLPLLALLVYGFSEKKTETKVKEIVKNELEKIIEITVYQDSIILKSQSFKLKEISEAIIAEIDPEIGLENHYLEGLTYVDFETEYMGSLTLEIRKSGIKHIKFCTPQQNVDENKKLDSNKSKNGPSKKQIKEYNSLAKKYNAMLSKEKSIQIKMKDVERLKYIYGLMSEKQRAGAEPFPDFPPPPKPPKAPKPPTPEENNNEFDEEKLENPIENQEIIAQENIQVYEHRAAQPLEKLNLNETLSGLIKRNAVFFFDDEKIDSNIGIDLIHDNPNLIVETYPYTNKTPVIKIYSELQKFAKNPEPPTQRKSPIDHVIEMAKKDAIFYYEEKKISSDKAIEILKRDKNINIDSRTSKGNKPVVKLSKKGTKIGYIEKTDNAKEDDWHTSFGIQDPNRPKEAFVKQIMEIHNDEAIYYYKGEKINLYKALDLIYSKRNLALATFKSSKSNKPIIILDRNFKKYNFKELMNL